MGLLTTGVLLWIVGKIAHIGLLEKIGYYCMLGGGILFVIGLFGFGISLPFVGGAI